MEQQEAAAEVLPIHQESLATRQISFEKQDSQDTGSHGLDCESELVEKNMSSKSGREAAQHPESSLDESVNQLTGVRPGLVTTTSEPKSSGQNKSKKKSVSVNSGSGVKKKVKRLHQCEQCGKCFASKRNLLVHHRVHSGERPFECDTCKKRFIQLAHLRCHTEAVHKEDETLKSEQASSNGNSSKTGCKAKVKRRYPCDQCEKTFPWKNALDIHYRVHSGERPFKCDVCQKGFTRLSHLQGHAAAVHKKEKPHKCQHCDKCFVDSCSLRVHIRTHTGEKPYECKQCNKRFRLSSQLTRHTRLHTGEKPFQCNVCGKQFTQHSSLICHSRIHTGEKPYQCKVCGKKFNQSGSLIIHSRRCTVQLQRNEGAADAIYMSNVPQATYHVAHYTPDALQSSRPNCELVPDLLETLCASEMMPGVMPGQQQISSFLVGVDPMSSVQNFPNGVPPSSSFGAGAAAVDPRFRCPQCVRTFASQTDLEKHQRVHSAERPFQCESCPKRFMRSSHLRIHIAGVHKKERPFSCQYCARYFADRGTLNVHIRGHTGEKPFQCKVCGKCFRNSSHLSNHSRIHTGEKPFECNVCGKHFRLSAHLAYHYRQHKGLIAQQERAPEVVCAPNVPQATSHVPRETQQYLLDVDCSHEVDCDSEPDVDEGDADREPDQLGSSGACAAGSLGVIQNQQQMVPSQQRIESFLSGCVPASSEQIAPNVDAASSSFGAGTVAVEPRYRCPQCVRTFDSQTDLEKHQRVHSAERPFQCDSCPKRFMRSSHLRIHIAGVHKKERPFSCQYCARCFADRGTLNVHIRSHTGEKPFQCKVCGKHFRNSSHLSNHSRIHTGEKPFECNVCGKHFRLSAHLAYHSIRHRVSAKNSQATPGLVRVSDMPRTTQQDPCVQDRIHLPSHTLGSNSQPEEAMGSVDGRAVLENSDESATGPACVTPDQRDIGKEPARSVKSRSKSSDAEAGAAGKKRYPCDQCEKSFTWKSDLKRHNRVHSGERPFMCDVCQKGFTRLSHLQGHVAAVHKKETPHSCQHCDKCFADLCALRVHIRTHTGEKPYVCKVCGKRFALSGQLTVHSRMHTGEKPYQCKVCDKRFSNSGQLTSHTRLHTGERPYQCNVCGKKFSQSGSLTCHSRLHSGERPYQCGECGMSFTQSSSLLMHSNVHMK